MKKLQFAIPLYVFAFAHLWLAWATALDANIEFPVLTLKWAVGVPMTHCAMGLAATIAAGHIWKGA